MTVTTSQTQLQTQIQTKTSEAATAIATAPPASDPTWNNADTYRSDGPLSIQNLPHLAGDTVEFNSVVAETESQIAKEDKRWSWKDVGSIFPMSDAWAGRPIQRPRSAVHRHEYVISASVEETYQALVYALKQSELMRCTVVQKQSTDNSKNQEATTPPHANTWYAVMRMDAPNLLERRIERIGVDSIEKGLETTHVDDYHDGARVQPPGPPVFFTLLHSANEPNKCGLLYQMQHAIFDITSLTLFLREIEVGLEGKKSLNDGDSSSSSSGSSSKSIVPSYGPYAYWRHSLPWTELGKSNLDFHHKRLSGIGQPGNASIWPEKRAKGWMRGNDKGYLGSPSERVPLGPTDEEQIGIYGDEFATNANGINQLRSEHGIPASRVVKAAEILFNVWKTGAKEAVFIGAEGGRTKPAIVPSELDILQVPGPVVAISLNRFAVDWQENTLDFLQRVQQDQYNLTKHCHMNMAHLLSSLSEQDRKFIVEWGPRQVFNWYPRMTTQDMKRLTRTKLEGRSDIGISWVFRLSSQPGEEDTVVLEASWDNCQLTIEEIQQATQQVLSAVKWLSNPDNANKPIQGCIFDSSTAYEYS